MEGILMVPISIFLLDYQLKCLFSLFGIVLSWDQLAQFALCTFDSGGKHCPGEEKLLLRVAVFDRAICHGST